MNLVSLVVAGIAILAAPGADAVPEPWPTEEWTRSSPADRRLDPERLEILTREIREGERFPDLHALLIVRNGYLVVEEYFEGYDAKKLHTLQSVSKSFTSALIGIAIAQGKIEGVDEKVLDFFPDAAGIENLDERKKSMMLQDLLTMRGGTDYHEGYPGSPHDQLNSLDHGWDRFVLSRPMVHEPGTHFQYDSGGVILMSAMLKNRTGMHADAYADRYLFPALGISRSRWHKNADGHPHTGGGLHLLPRDMAKFGLLYLRGGRWEDRQVVPANWVEESTRRHVKLEGRGGRAVGYGYLWWILPPDPKGPGKRDIFAAMGFRAQYIFVVPEHDMVVVVTGGTQSGTDQRMPIEFLYSHILPAVRR
jgi:CubicO group peptidase (beta-lactamase class C family)